MSIDISQTALGEQPTQAPELVVGLVGAVGSNLNELSAVIAESLKRVRYDGVSIGVTDLFPNFAADFSMRLRPEPLEARYFDKMDIGDELRRRLNHKESAILPVIDLIREARDSADTS